MSQDDFSTLLLVVGVVGLFAVVGFAVASALGIGVVACKAKPLMTPNEMEFLGRLESACPELRFHSQTSMAAIMEPAVSSKANAKAYWKARGQFDRKIIDYVAQRRDNGDVVAVVELDDRTHDAAKDAKRDRMLSGAGYRTVRWQSRNKPDAAAIRKALLHA